MEISVEFKGFEQTFRTTIRGVTKQNRDGTDRQVLVKTLRPGEELKLVREPENPYDKYAVAVFRSTGEQLGYVPAGDIRLAHHIDSGGPVTVKVVEVTGRNGILGLLFSPFRKSYGCVIEIVKGDFNWKELRPYMEKSRTIEELITAAKAIEATDPTNAISKYREAIEQIVAFDKAGTVAASWRRARYPITRLSLLLEKRGDLRGALDEILQYERFKDGFGLLSADSKSVASRKKRLLKKLSV